MSNYVVGMETRLYNGAFKLQTPAYNIFIDMENKIWLVGDIKNRADYIYVDMPTGVSPPGMKATFDIAGHAGYIILENVYKSNAASFYKATGLDLRKTYLTYVVISKRKDANNVLLMDVLYQDAKPVLSNPMRGIRKAKRLSKSTGAAVYCYLRGIGGYSIQKIEVQ